MLTMGKKPLNISANKRWKGLNIYCYKCKTNVTAGICKESGKPLKECIHGDKHVFKIYISVPGTKNQRKTRTIETRDINEAIKEAILFEQEVKGKNPTVQKIMEAKPQPKLIAQSSVRPMLLVQALARYIGWLHGEGVPVHLIKERSKNHIRDVERGFEKSVTGLVKAGYDLDSLKVDDLRDEHVGIICSYLRANGIQGRTFNKYISYLVSWAKWYNEEYDLIIRNWFKRVKREPENPNKEAITFKEFNALLAQITPENGIRHYDNHIKPTRSLYRPWLSQGIRLGFETGRRIEEIANLKWSYIDEEEGNQFIKIEDYKVNHIQKRNLEKNKKYVYIPMTKTLIELLNELGYQEKGTSDEYILAPEITQNRKNVISDVLCRGFSHYFEQLNSNKHLTFKSLRKAYITNLVLYLGAENARSVTGHSSTQIIENNYLDKKEIAKALRGFNPNMDSANRAQSMQELRNEKSNPNVNIDR